MVCLCTYRDYFFLSIGNYGVRNTPGLHIRIRARIHTQLYTTPLANTMVLHANAKLYTYNFALGFPCAAASSNLLLSPPCVTATGASNTVLSGFSLRARASTYSRSPEPRYTCRGRQILTPDGVSICCRQWANHPTQRGTANRTG